MPEKRTQPMGAAKAGSGQVFEIDAPPDSAGTAALQDGDILGCTVQTKPGTGRRVAQAIRGIGGLEIHAGEAADRLVITIEDVIGQSAADVMGALNQVDGVIGTTLVYHCAGRAFAPSPTVEAKEASRSRNGSVAERTDRSSPFEE